MSLMDAHINTMQREQTTKQNKFQTAVVTLYRLIRNCARPLWAVGQVSDRSSLMCATVWETD